MLHKSKLVLSTLGLGVSIVPVSILGMSALILPLGKAFDWGRGTVALGVTLLTIALAIAVPVAGRLIDRFGAARLLVFSLALYAAALCLIPLLISAFGLPGFYAGMVLVGLVGAGSSTPAYVKIITFWFEQQRGLALGVLMCGIGLGAAASSIVASTAVHYAGWQAGFYALAMMPLVIGLPAALLLQEKSVGPHVVMPNAIDTEGSVLSFRDTLHSLPFILLAIIFFVEGCAIHGVQLHLSAALVDQGVPAMTAAQGFSYLFLVSIIARLASGYMFDRVFAPRIGAFCFTAPAIGLMLLVFAPFSFVNTILALTLIGIGTGAEADLLAYLTSRYYSAENRGRIYGSLYGVALLGGAAGPYVIGAAYDHSGNYILALTSAAAALAAASALLLFLPRFQVKSVEAG